MLQKNCHMSHTPTKSCPLFNTPFYCPSYSCFISTPTQLTPFLLGLLLHHFAHLGQPGEVDVGVLSPILLGHTHISKLVAVVLIITDFPRETLSELLRARTGIRNGEQIFYLHLISQESLGGPRPARLKNKTKTMPNRACAPM